MGLSLMSNSWPKRSTLFFLKKIWLCHGSALIHSHQVKGAQDRPQHSTDRRYAEEIFNFKANGNIFWVILQKFYTILHQLRGFMVVTRFDIFHFFFSIII